MDYTLIRSKRKSISIHVTEAADVEVRAPLKLSKAEIDRLVVSKEAWITEQLGIRQQRLASKASFVLDYGSSVILQGKAFPLEAREGKRVGFDGACFYLPPGLPPEEIKRVVVKIYRIMAKNLLTAKVADYAAQMGVAPTSVKINGAKARWGSCSNRGSINFSWRLILAEDAVIDYVVVHELAHMKELNHSARFWALVAAVIPDYKARQKKLKELQTRLAGEDWD